jgi:nitroreductase
MNPRTIPLTGYRELPPEEMVARARAFADEMSRRRTVREFSARAVPRALIEECLRAAGSAPSGANQQPWHFVAVSDAGVKRRIRAAAEAEEREFYAHRAPPEWLEVLRPLGTDAEKPFLEIAPWLVAVFIRRFERLPTPSPMKFLNDILGRPRDLERPAARGRLSGRRGARTRHRAQAARRLHHLRIGNP